jgi:hypothetical protein
VRQTSGVPAREQQLIGRDASRGDDGVGHRSGLLDSLVRVLVDGDLSVCQSLIGLLPFSA